MWSKFLPSLLFRATWLGRLAAMTCVLISGLHLASASNLPIGYLLYSGLTDNGWQIFKAKLPHGSIQQLTFSPGDKRKPTYLIDRQITVARDTKGVLLTVDGKGTEKLFASGKEPWARFSFFPDGRILVAHLVSPQMRRQYLFVYDAQTGLESSFAEVPSGSFRYGQVSPDGSTVAVTHLLTYGEERLGVLDVKKGAADIRYLTPDNVVVEDPFWSADGNTIYFASQDAKSEGTMLRSVNMNTGVVSSVSYTKLGMDSSPFPTADGRGLFFETSDGSQSRIVYLDFQTKENEIIPFGRSARDPFFIPQRE